MKMEVELKDRLIALVKNIHSADTNTLEFDMELAKNKGYSDRELKLAGLMLSSMPNWCAEIEEIANMLYDFKLKPEKTVLYYIKFIDIVAVVDRNTGVCNFYDKKELDKKVKEKKLAGSE